MGKNSKNNKKMSKNISKPSIEAKVIEVEEIEVEDSTSIEDINDQEIDNEQEIESSSTKKIKKVVLFSEEWEQLIILRSSESDLRDDKERLLKEYEQQLKEINIKMKKNRKDQKIIFDKMPSLHTNEIKTASKEKRKRSGKNTGGFNKECEVPSTLAKYLGINVDEKLTRPSVFAKLNEKFKEEGLKSGQNTILDKKNAKLLGKPSGTIIPFSEGQTFLASFYKEMKSINV